jgi:hypothetical protein
MTYVRCEIEEELTPKILFWLGESDIKKWYHKMRRHVKRMPEESKTTNLQSKSSYRIPRVLA